MKSQRPKVLD